MGDIIDGRALAAEIHRETAVRVAMLRDRGVVPSLAFIRVGEDPASQVYVGMKEKKAAELGIRSDTFALPAATPRDEVVALIGRLNQDAHRHAILVQAPLPRPLDAADICALVDPRKDVDGFHPENLGRLMLGDPSGFAPCTPAGVQRMLQRCGLPMEGADVIILGRGHIVGKPLANLLMQRSREANCTVTVVHRATRDIAGRCRAADVLIAAMGSPEFVRADMVKPGAVVIDVGVNRVTESATGKSRLVGDVAFEEVRGVAGAITPNPGGVGPMTIAMLMANTVRAAEQAAALRS